ncbi:GTP cyclohydrolase I [Micromonospora sp. NPDC005299]|uniref:GTP cyclohydrolase I n=1 Tax=Micromonospora sp. NPDC005299 TaxID=3364231 RepID=UPI0036AB41C8
MGIDSIDEEIRFLEERVVGTDPIEGLALRLLEEIGEDPSRDGIKDTPARYAKWWREFIDYDPGKTEMTFESATTGQLVIVSGIDVWSLCEHHLLPFNCSLTIAYRPEGQVLGLSKFARIAHQFAHRLQIQERLVSDISSEVIRITGASDVAVVGTGEHLCMTMRGIKTSARMTSTSLHGRFEYDPELRNELWAHRAAA